LILLPVVAPPARAIPPEFLPFTLHLGKEILAGLVIGYASTLVFLGVMLAGQVIDFQMGFSIVSLIDPITNLRVSIVGQLKYMISLLVFLTINGHHLLLSALAKSFEVSPLSTFNISQTTADNMVSLFCNLFVIALKIGLPAIGVLLMTTVVLGILARTVPQMNVFIVGMPLKIAVGFVALILILPFLVVYLEQLFNGMPNELLKLLA
jgi:flagellar biosynthetic protein FliR